MSERKITVPPILEKILLEYTVNVLVEHPEDIISHAADYFTRLRDNRDNDKSDWTIEEITHIGNHLGARAARRQSVVGERYDPEEDGDDEEIEKFPKTDDERKMIKKRIEDIFLFKDLDEVNKNEIADAMMSREVIKGQVIIHQGDDGDFFYVVDKGTFEASVKNANGEEIVVKTYDNSGSFGELALLHNQPRAATVTATTDGLLWAVSRKTFTRLVVKRAFDKRQKYMALLQKVTELQPLMEFEKMQVCDALKPVSLNNGEILFEEGDEGDGMYFVEDGKISIMQWSTRKKREQEVAQYGPGGYFGDQVKRWDKSIKLSDDGKVLIKNAEVIIMDCTYLAELLYSLPNAKWVQTTWAGLELLMESVDKTKPSPNFSLTRYVDPYFGELMSNYVIAQIINIERGFYMYRDAQKIATWSRPFFPDFRVLSDLTVGILGAGKLGASVGCLLKKAGCSVLVFVRNSRGGTPTDDYDEATTNLNDVLERCDYLVNVLPSTPETVGLLDEDVLKNCQKKPVFINIGRGDIIKESNIIKALKEGWISKAILDVFEAEPLPPDSPLWSTPEVYITPHVGAIPRIDGIAKFIAQNYTRYIKKAPMLNEVDLKKGY